MIASLGSSVGSLTDIIIKRVVAGFSTLPTVNDWLNTIALLLVYAVIALPIGLGLNFLQFDWQLERKTVIKILITSLIAPAILEELLFRVILIPQPLANRDFRTILIYSAIASFLFIIYHPLNALTFFPAGRETFFNPVFLFLAALLGVICTISYLQSGSIWSPVVIHWVTVVIWLLCLGGVNKLQVTQSNI